MALSSVNLSNPFSYLQSLLQSSSGSSSGVTGDSAPSDALQTLYQSFSGDSSGDQMLAAIGADSSSGASPQFSLGMMQQLLSVQGDQASPAQTLFSKFDADGNGQISQTEFENAIGPNADQSQVDALFNQVDSNGDGSISEDEMQSAMQKAQAGHHHHHHHGGTAGAGQAGGGDPLQQLLAGASADGTTSQVATNADGSTTTTLTYSDGTKIEMTTPAAASDTDQNATGSGTQSLNFAAWLKQMISLQAQFAPPTTSLTV